MCNFDVLVLYFSISTTFQSEILYFSVHYNWSDSYSWAYFTIKYIVQPVAPNLFGFELLAVTLKSDFSIRWFYLNDN